MLVGGGEGGVGVGEVRGCEKSERNADIVDLTVSYCCHKLRHCT